MDRATCASYSVFSSSQWLPYGKCGSKVPGLPALQENIYMTEIYSLLNAGQVFAICCRENVCPRTARFGAAMGSGMCYFDVVPETTGAPTHTSLLVWGLLHPTASGQAWRVLLVVEYLGRISFCSLNVTNEAGFAEATWPSCLELFLSSKSWLDCCGAAAEMCLQTNFSTPQRQSSSYPGSKLKYTAGF